MYKYGVSYLILFTKTHQTKMSIYWYVGFVYFSGAKTSIEFKVTEYTSLVDMKSIIGNLLEYSDNKKVVKLEYCLSLIDNERKTQFNNFELKTDEDLRVMWSTFYRYKIKCSIELVAKISWRCWNILLDNKIYCSIYVNGYLYNISIFMSFITTINANLSLFLYLFSFYYASL